MIVASLLRRASVLARLDFGACVVKGVAQAGADGEPALAVLLNASADTPSTHRETGDAGTFAFERVPPEFDASELQLWLERGGKSSLPAAEA